MANVFRQDFPVVGHTTQVTVMHNINREGGRDYYNNNGILINICSGHCGFDTNAVAGCR